VTIPRPSGSYTSRMTTPPAAWPEVDEDLHANRAGELFKTGIELDGAADMWGRTRTSIFDGNTWFGRGSDSGKTKVEDASRLMQTVGSAIGSAIAFHRNAYQAVKNAKERIVANCDAAQKVIDDLLSKSLSSDEAQQSRTKAIAEIVEKALKANTAIVTAAATAVAAGQVYEFSDKDLPDFKAGIPDFSSSKSALEGPSGVKTTAPTTRSAVGNAPAPAAAPAAGPRENSARPAPNTVAAAAGNNEAPKPTNVAGPAPAKVDSPAGQGHIETGTGTTAQKPPQPSAARPSVPAAASAPSLNMGGGGGAPSAPSTGGGASSGGSTSSPSQSMSGASAGAKAGADMGAAKADPSADAKNAPAKAGAAGASGGGGEKAPADQVAKGLSTAQAATAQPTMAPAAATAPPPTPLAPPSDPAASAPIQHTAGSTGGGGGGTGGGGVGGMAGGGGSFGSPATSAPTPPPMPLGPPATPPPAGPPSPGSGGSTPGQTAASTSTGPGVNPASASRVDPALAGMAPIPVSPARLERDAILSASTAGAMQRHRGNASAALIQARRIAAALNMGAPQYGFYWVTGLTADGSIVVANSFGLAYVPDGIELPAHVTLASADETISPVDRGKWATYPILAIQGWAQAHDQTLRAVIATKEQFANFDPGVPKVVLQRDDIPETGKMQGRSRLEVIAPSVATRLASVPDAGLQDLLPVAPTDSTAPEDKSAALWFALIKPLMSTSPDRGVAHLEAFVTYADHAQQLALHKAHNALDAEVQRAAIADWVYWQHLSVLMSDAISAEVTV